MKGQLAGLMKQAQAMQDNLKRAQAEPGFKNDESLPAAPPCWQVIAAKKNVTSLRMPSVSGVVNLGKLLRARCPLGVKNQMGRFESDQNGGLNIKGDREFRECSIAGADEPATSSLTP